MSSSDINRLEIEKLFPEDESYTFLVGAGISMNSPTNLPSAISFVEQLVNLCAPEEEIDTILKLDNLRFEMIVEQVQEYFDSDLKFMDYFDVVSLPNSIHLFLVAW